MLEDFSGQQKYLTPKYTSYYLNVTLRLSYE